MSDVIAEQISIGLQKLYAVVELLSYASLQELKREIGFLELMIMQREQKLRENALKSKVVK